MTKCSIIDRTCGIQSSTLQTWQIVNETIIHVFQEVRVYKFIVHLQRLKKICLHKKRANTKFKKFIISRMQ